MTATYPEGLEAFQRREYDEYQAAIAWRQAAIADGWAAEPMYTPVETVDQSSKLSRDGWIVHVITRDERESYARYGRGPAFYTSIAAWAPDGLAVVVPDGPYDWEALKAAANQCRYCGAVVDETHRVGFAGRACAECVGPMRKQHEFPGWTS